MSTEAIPPVGDAPAATPATPAPEATPPAGDAPTAPAAATIEITPELQAVIDENRRQASQDANREAAALRKRTKELEDAEQARKDAQLSETERLQKERDDAVKAAETATIAARTLAVNSAVERAATAAGFADPTDALTLAAAIELDDNGQPVGVTEAVAALLAAKPHYAAATGTPQLDPTNGARMGGAGNQPVSDAQRLAELRNPPAGNIFGRRS